ncbi:DUF4407 domain-containing protein [Kitasatospora cineracea]|uniref:DUF7144 domain-containing protein n=1 Tax=Kitasatospora cineracea TaxID=88074 RepID=A0A8G1UII1_9ACTN|nr:DUF4407 domain-containing protein [Kitasatospora cineracea]ROR44611.1 hypothetical protein EDD39_2816 [Kitasatospora cineracea]
MSSSVGPTATPPAGPRAGGTRAPRNKGWVSGMVLFAGVVMLVNGILEVFHGIMAIAEDDVFVSTPRYVFRFDLTGWGWIHLVIGALVALVGFFVIQGAAWARIAGIFLASLSLIGSFLALPYYPLWALVIIALDVFVIWALCVYRED